MKLLISLSFGGTYLLAQTTDSGSNNNTMAVEMHCLFEEALSDEDPPIDWNPKTMSIKCFCHILQLIVNGGLNSLRIRTSGPRAIKRATLGSFPQINTLPTIDEEVEVENSSNHDKPDEDDFPDSTEQPTDKATWDAADCLDDEFKNLQGPPDPLPTPTVDSLGIDLLESGLRTSVSPEALNDIREKVRS